MSAGTRGAGKKPLAVALQYDRPHTPRVTAKGGGEVAERILEVARANDIPIEENRELAAALAQVELDQEIPENLFRAVAEVLGYILRMSGQRR
jgi:flagellar biosynthesis protein